MLKNIIPAKPNKFKGFMKSSFPKENRQFVAELGYRLVLRLAVWGLEENAENLLAKGLRRLLNHKSVHFTSRKGCELL